MRLPLLLLIGAFVGCAEDPDRRRKRTTESDTATRTTLPVTGTVVDGGRLVEHGEVVCADPTARETLGPTWVPDLGKDWDWQRPLELGTGERVSGAGVAVADLNGDGRLDLFVPEETGCMLYLQQPDGTLALAPSDHVPLPGPGCHGWSASAADYDGDGDLDLYVGRHKEPDQLWQNDGQGRFTDVSAAVGLVEMGCATRSASFGDMDGDGDLDLFVARHRASEGENPESCPDVEAPRDWPIPAGDPNMLYRNDGGRFTDVSGRLDFEGIYGHAFMGAWHDLDGDGDLDLYVVNDFGSRAAPGRAYRNDGAGNFAPFALNDGLEVRGCLMGLGVGDLDADGLPDLAISEVGHVFLLKSGPGIWVDGAMASGLVLGANQRAGWGVELADMDNDGLLDIPVVFGPVEGRDSSLEGRAEEQPDALFLQRPDGTFEDVAPAWDLDRIAVGRGLVVVDFDRDGWLDVIRPDYRVGSVELRLQRCGSEAWLAVDFEGPLDGFGAVVQARVGDQVLTRWNDPTSTSFASSGPSEVHFGLGEADVVDELVVTWAGGRVDRFEDVAVRQRVTVVAD